jgi:exonuclease III
MERQVEHVSQLLKRYSKQASPWIIGGDFNLLPPGIDKNKNKRRQSATSIKQAPKLLKYSTTTSQQGVGPYHRLYLLL